MAILDDLKAAQAKAVKQPTTKTITGSSAPVYDPNLGATIVPTAPSVSEKPVVDVTKMGASESTPPVGNTPSGGGSGNVVPPNVSPVRPLSVTPTPKKEISADTMDAFASLQLIFESYGLGDLADTITKLMTDGYTPQSALVKLKYDKGYVNGKDGARWNDAYTTRFSANATRISKGLNALSEAEYISNENSYAETLKSYGLGNMLSVDRAANQKTFADYISGDVSPTEFKDRIATASDRVINADANTKAMFKQFYPNITDSDLVAYFLKPEQTLGMLKEKATAAEIGGAAIGQGLNTSMTSATELARFGVDRAQAMAGYQDIAGVLPEAEKLGNIYGETKIKYTQQTGEEEFLKSSDAAKRKRNMLASKERASFQGSAGISTTGSLRKTTAGQI